MSDNPSLLLIGHSHLTAIEAGFHSGRARDGERGGEAAFVQLLEKRYAPALTPPIGEAAELNPDIARDIAAALAGLHAPTIVGATLGGNEYHFLGMVRPSPCYDFEYEAVSAAPLVAGAQIVSREAVRSAIRHYASGAIAFVAPLRRVLPSTVVIIESPPPIPSNAFLMSDRSPFYDQIRDQGVMPPSVRYKLWRLQCEVFAEVARDAGWAYLSAPAAASDEDGFMRRDGWHADGVHGTAWYGELVVEQLRALSA